MTSVRPGWKGFGSGVAANLFGSKISKGTEKPVAACNAFAAAADNPIFISLPRRAPAAQGHCSGSIYFEKPSASRARFRQSTPQHRATRTSGIIWKAIPFVGLLITIYAALGMLRMMVEGVSLPESYPSVYLKTQSSRGGGPSPLDAVKNDYQNALTREMVAVADTGAGAEMIKETKKKSKTDSRITVGTSRYSSSQKKGLHNLKFKIFNGTPQTLDKVAVEVDFYGRKGKLLKTETFSATEVGPKSEKIISVPEGTPGLKVQYRISEVKSKKHTTQLHHL